MNKLIKLSETHYIIVDYSEIKEEKLRWIIDYRPSMNGFIHQVSVILDSKLCPEITHSTHPLEKSTSEYSSMHYIFDKIKPLSLSEVEELVNGFSAEKMAENFVVDKVKNSSQAVGVMVGYIEGFKAYRELVKDKLFTIEDLYVAFSCGRTYEKSNHHGVGQNELVDYIKSLKKTEWNIEFDEQGKLKLI